MYHTKLMSLMHLKFKRRKMTMIGVASIERWDTIKFDCSKRRQWFKRKGKSLIKGFVLFLFFFFYVLNQNKLK